MQRQKLSLTAVPLYWRPSSKRRLKIMVGIVGFLILLLLWPRLSMAGGWAVVTVERVPTQVMVDEPLAITFMVRQHGQHPVHVDTALKAIHVDSGETLTFGATPLPTPGRHAVEISLPHPGEWRWQIEVNPFLAEFGWLTLRVLPADGTRSQPMEAQTNHHIHGIQALVELILKFMQGNIQSIQPVADPIPSIQSEAIYEFPADEWALGKTLFVAKGCAGCHTHNEVGGRSSQIGHDLSNYHRDGDFLRYWLRNSGAATANLMWGMPTLELEDHEIEALIAFLVSEGS